ncbi:hypothetical protein, partial [Escherichia coli]|uniref:hypothetical protein n=1 Tax=Escherichia coli TaxID=562 RepID=UPI001BC85DB1
GELRLRKRKVLLSLSPWHYCCGLFYWWKGITVKISGVHKDGMGGTKSQIELKVKRTTPPRWW